MLKHVTYFGQIGWGDALHFSSGKGCSVYGWKPYHFNDSEVVAIKYKADEPDSQCPVYILTNVEWQKDPKDMFFAKARKIGVLPYYLVKAQSDLFKHKVQSFVDSYYRWSIYYNYTRLLAILLRTLRTIFNRK